MSNKKRGRPIKEDSRTKVRHVRLTDVEDEMVDDLCIGTDMTSSDVIRKAIIMYYNMRKSGY